MLSSTQQAPGKEMGRMDGCARQKDRHERDEEGGAYQELRELNR